MQQNVALIGRFDRGLEMSDELAARRAAQGIVTIKICASSSSIVRHVPTRTVDPVARLRRIAASMKARRRLHSPYEGEGRSID
jgi:hypothetical protein